MGLVKLYRATNDARWLTLARIFLEARGPGGPSVYQQHERVVDQTEAVGHAVRANYLYAGMADVAALAGDPGYVAATKRIWQNVVSKKLYLTGGVGALADGEKYGAGYELPLDGYAETCAAIALMFWSHRLFLLTGDGRYVDVFERAAHNGFVSGVSLGGERFFYSNPLVHDGVAKNNHGHAGRAPWFGCACCPPNVLRTLAAFSAYLYAARSDALYVNVYAASQGVVTLGATRVQLTQLTDYPWSGRIRLQIEPEAPVAFALHLRIPGWARGEPVPSELYRYEDTTDATWTVLVNGERVSHASLAGYAVIEREWRAGDRVELVLPMSARRVRGHDRIDAVRGRVALERGPVVYCVEQSDVGVPLAELALTRNARLSPLVRPSLLGGVTVLRVEGEPVAAFDAVPYHAWNNRGLAPMSVWLSAEPG